MIDMATAFTISSLSISAAWTLALSNGVSGYLYRIWFIQNTTGGGSAAPTPTFSPTVTWAGGTPPTLTTTANKRDMVECYYTTAVFSGYMCKITQNY